MTAEFRERYRIGLLFGVVAVLLCAWILTLTMPLTPTKEPAAGPGTGLVDTGALELEIRGSLAYPLSPGNSGGVDLSFSNNHGTAVNIRNIIVTVDAVDAPRSTPALPCTVEDFAVEQTAASLTLRSGETARLSEAGVAAERFPHVGMINAPTNQDGCVDASLTLGFRAVGEEKK
jgi:hypothetical protein